MENQHTFWRRTEPGGMREVALLALIAAFHLSLPRPELFSSISAICRFTPVSVTLHFWILTIKIGNLLQQWFIYLLSKYLQIILLFMYRLVYKYIVANKYEEIKQEWAICQLNCYLNNGSVYTRHVFTSFNLSPLRSTVHSF